MEIVPSRLPDISLQTRAAQELPLAWVGMGDIELPISLRLPGAEPLVPARVQAGVSLDQPEARGVHMSRVFAELQKRLIHEPLTFATLREVCHRLIVSQDGLSSHASVRVALSLPVERRALLSDLKGWRQYPVEIGMVTEPGRSISQLGFQVLYSSTCPASAALARQLVQNEFLGEFAHRQQLSPQEVAGWLGREESMAGTPHAQRSRAEIRLNLVDTVSEIPLPELLDRAETTLATPVQTAVKRVDEQEFARLNARNLMFCEDAARRLGHMLGQDARIKNWWLRVEHQESLHAHNAVAIACQNPRAPISWY